MNYDVIREFDSLMVEEELGIAGPDGELRKRLKDQALLRKHLTNADSANT